MAKVPKSRIHSAIASFRLHLLPREAKRISEPLFMQPHYASSSHTSSLTVSARTPSPNTVRLGPTRCPDRALTGMWFTAALRLDGNLEIATTICSVINIKGWGWIG